MMNLGQYKYKQSKFEKILNVILCGNLICAIILAFINIGLYAAWTKKHLLAKDMKYVFYNFA